MRRFLAHALVLCGSAADEAEAALVLSELVSNALEYGQATRLSVALRIEPERIVIEVVDESGAAPQIQRPSPTADSGRGLQIVDCIADTWGWRYPDGEHKVVWAVLDGSD